VDPQHSAAAGRDPIPRAPSGQASIRRARARGDRAHAGAAFRAAAPGPDRARSI